MKVKPSEKRLLIFLGIAFFLVGNFYLWSLLNEGDQKIKIKHAKLENDYKRFNALKSQVPLAKERQEAFAKYLKRYDSYDTRDTYLVTFVQNKVSEFGLKLAKNAPLAGDSDEYFIKSAYQAEVSGEWKKVLEFIHALQEPTEFRFVKTLNLTNRKSEAQDGESELVCNFTIQKWWHPDSDALLAEQPAVAATPNEQKSTAGVQTKEP